MERSASFGTSYSPSVSMASRAQSAPVRLLSALPFVSASRSEWSDALSDDDVTAYRHTFAFQEQGDWEQANYLLATIQDRVLIGALRAQRYLHADYNSRYDELADWLNRYGDMPEAPRIAALAKRKAPAGVRVQSSDHEFAKLKGSGTRDGIHGAVMPSAFQSGLKFWQAGQYQQAATQFERVAAKKKLSGWHRSAAHYWAWRANERIGRSDRAIRHLELAAAQPHTLYGLLATRQLGSVARADYPLPTMSTAMKKRPAVQRAAAYVAIGMRAEAEQELRVLYKQVESYERPQLLKVAQALDLPALQLRMSQTGTAYRHHQAAFPTPMHWVDERQQRVDAALIFAVARQESAFNPQARNPRSGATGVMQLMPDTARYVIRKYRLNEVQVAGLGGAPRSSISMSRLTDPRVNVTIGQHYLHYLSGKPYIQRDVIQMLAAYNAGPGNLLDWQKRFDVHGDPLLFIEQIPFKETRQYVKQVLTNYMVYRQVIHGRDDVVQTLAAGQWPKVR